MIPGGDLLHEEWRAIPGLEGRYEVSNRGRVRSLNYARTGRTQVMKLQAHHTGYKFIRAGKYNPKQWYVHTAVMAAFVGPRPDPKAHIRHLDGDRTNNDLANLRYGTASENMFDRALLGEDHNARRDSCKNGHPFNEENTYIRKDGGRRGCRTCRRRWVSEYEHRQRTVRQDAAA